MSSPGGGCADSGPGVLPLPGDRASSFIAPPYDSDELGGLCETKEKESKLVALSNTVNKNVTLTYEYFITITN